MGFEEFSTTGQLLYNETVLSKTKIGFKDRLSLNAGQKYRRMLPFAPRGAFCNTFDLD